MPQPLWSASCRCGPTRQRIRRADPGATVSSLEAYIGNSDPTAALPKDANGNLTIAAPATVGVPGPGHNAWQMTSAGLVLFMTLPGLALFYGGLVRRKNVLSVMAQCLLITGLVTILWWAFGYSLVFHSGNARILGRSGVCVSQRT